MSSVCDDEEGAKNCWLDGTTKRWNDQVTYLFSLLSSHSNSKNIYFLLWIINFFKCFSFQVSFNFSFEHELHLCSHSPGRMWMDSCGQNEFYKNKTGMKFKNIYFFYVYIKIILFLPKKRLKTKLFSLCHIDKKNSPGEKNLCFHRWK